MGQFFNIDLLSVGIAIAANVVLGYTVFLNDRKSLTNRTFLIFTFSTVPWSILNYLIFQKSYPNLALWILRGHIFFAVWYCFFLFKLFFIFPSEKFYFPKTYYLLTAIAVFSSLIALTPLVFERVSKFSPAGGIEEVINGPGIFIFGITIVILIVGALVSLGKKLIRASGLEKFRLQLVLTGTIITFLLHFIFNFIFPTFFNNPRFAPLGALFIFPFIIFTSYAILRHKLFNIKVAGAASLVFLLSVVTFAEVILAGSNIALLLFRSVVFILVLLFGILLIKSVLREVEQREKIENLATQLAVANDELKTANQKLQELDKMKTEFVSMATHQLRSPLTAIKGYASMVLENSFGEIGEKARGAVDVIFQSSEKLVKVIEDFLNITRIELGTMKYEKSEFDFRSLVENVVKELKVNIEQRGLQFSFEADPTGDYKLVGDSGKLAQVVGNLIDNTIKYTTNGWIKTRLSKTEEKIKLEISDSGVGMPAEVIPKLFQKFIRAEDAGKINIQGTGLGLYVARQIVEAHGGRIWAESKGVGQGSRFVVELGTEKIPA